MMNLGPLTMVGGPSTKDEGHGVYHSLIQTS